MVSSTRMLYGTHNSCTYGSLQGCCMCVALPWTQNQTLTFVEQLEKGVRYFDFRISYSTNDAELYLSHTLLTENRLTTILNELSTFLERHPESPMIMIHVRVDYKDRPNQSVVQRIITPMLSFYSKWFLTSSEIERDRFEKVSALPQKVLLYCADGTIQHPCVFSSDLMPMVDFWNAGTEEECERRLQHLEELFDAQKNGPFLFSNQRLLMFDFSNEWPLWITDRQQLSLIEKYKALIIKANPTILAGNHIEKIMNLF